VTYGLGSDNQNLPGFIAMCPGGYPIQETQNWQAAFLPGASRAPYIDTRHTQAGAADRARPQPGLSRPQQRQQLDLLRQLNERHLERRPQDAQLEARIQSFELPTACSTTRGGVRRRARTRHVRNSTAPGCRRGNC